ncbi:hypothetical protein ACFFUA_25830 [Streptomyces heliomycini]|uniref:VOC domain-containing protein n=1 Tax=Streptomyces heliomycini TaxID=284032 RepID=A0ABV5LF81_9ACTN|nr:hypothetical protein [Streptomyces sp. XY152]
MEQSAPVTGGLCWAELGTTDPESARRFYTRLFGWRPETDPRQESGGHTVAYLGDAAVAAVTTTTVEGTVLMEPVSHPEGPRIAVLRDPQGAMFGVYRAADGRWAGDGPSAVTPAARPGVLPAGRAAR